MTNTLPYGYKMENGTAVTEQTEAQKVKELFKFYLDGNSLQTAGKLAEITACHAQIGNMLKNPKYMGDGYYPQIIDKETFTDVQKLRAQKADTWKTRIRKKEVIPIVFPTSFTMGIPDKLSDDPFRQAEYMFSLIEVAENGK